MKVLHPKFLLAVGHCQLQRSLLAGRPILRVRFQEDFVVWLCNVPAAQCHPCVVAHTPNQAMEPSRYTTESGRTKLLEVNFHCQLKVPIWRRTQVSKSHLGICFSCKCFFGSIPKNANSLALIWIIGQKDHSGFRRCLGLSIDRTKAAITLL